MSPADIARGLTPAQKRALLWLPNLGGVALWQDVLPSGHSIVSWTELEKVGSVEIFSGIGVGLTPFGQSVRAALVEARADG
jgi:hypothetical protein